MEERHDIQNIPAEKAVIFFGSFVTDTVLVVLPILLNIIKNKKSQLGQSDAKKKIRPGSGAW